MDDLSYHLDLSCYLNNQAENQLLKDKIKDLKEDLRVVKNTLRDVRAKLKEIKTNKK